MRDRAVPCVVAVSACVVLALAFGALVSRSSPVSAAIATPDASAPDRDGAPVTLVADVEEREIPARPVPGVEWNAVRLSPERPLATPSAPQPAAAASADSGAGAVEAPASAEEPSLEEPAAAPAVTPPALALPAAGAPPPEAAEKAYALLIGVDEYAGGVRDLTTAGADVETLRQVLLAGGWRDDHILVLRDAGATRGAVLEGLAWLGRVAGEDSTVVVSFSGHTKQRDGNPDGDAEALDEGWWTHEGDAVWDAEIGTHLANVRAGALWLTVQACEAGGYDDPGTLAPGRLVTWSSSEEEKSFEDPEFGFSTQAHRLFAEALRDGFGDADGDGRVSVQEAAAWSAPRVAIRTDGLQHPVTADHLGRPLYLDLRPLAVAEPGE